MLNAFISAFQWWAAAFGGFELMTRYRDGSDKPYLARWMFFKKNNVFNVFLHNFLASDAESLHDHPCDFLLIGLRGWYLERQIGKIYKREAGQMRVMTAETFHRVVVPMRQDVWTLAVRGPNRKAWGFLAKDPEWTRWSRGSK